MILFRLAGNKNEITGIILAIKKTTPKLDTANVELSAIIHFVITGRRERSAKKKKSKTAIVFEGLNI